MTLAYLKTTTKTIINVGLCKDNKNQLLGLIFVSLRTLLGTLLYFTLLYFARENGQLAE
jgi:hypothetical protein